MRVLDVGPRRPRREGLGLRRRLALLTAMGLTLLLPVGPALAYWSTGSGDGGSGASAATSVQRGATPVATVSGAGVTVDWEASTLASGEQVTGYRIQRYDEATHTPQAVLSSCAGRQAGTSCLEDDVPPGQWRYTVTPLIGTSWTGAESDPSNLVTTDTTPPVNALSLSDLAGGAVKAGDTVYYRGVAPGSFTLTNAVSDAGSGPADSTTTPLGGAAAGWAHTPSRVSTPTQGPYVSTTFTWAGATTGTVGETVRGRDAAGNETATDLTFVDDSTAPSGATLSYPNGYQPERSVVVSLGNGSDAGSGIGSRQLQRSSSAMVLGLCQVQGGFTDVGPVDPASPYVDQDVTDGSCYRYRYLVTDRLGNQAVATNANVAKVDSSFGGPLLRSAAGYSVLGGTGVTNLLATSVSGDLGLSTSGLIAGFPPGIVGGDVDDKNPEAVQAEVDLRLAYADAAARTSTTSFAGDQINQTFHPGVHRTAAAFSNTGTMTLDADGDPNAIFVFQIGAAMGPAAGSQLLLVDGATASHVFWQVNGAVTVGANASMSGTIMADGAITLGNGVVLTGRALATGAVTMSANTIRFTTAAQPTVSIDGAGPGGSTDVTKDTTPTITGTSNAPAGTTLTLKIDGQVLTTAVLADGTWSRTVGELSAGSWAVVASVRDTSGNNGSATQLLTVEVNPGPVALATAGSYSLLGGSGVTNTGATTVSGDLGLSPLGAITGFPPELVGGDIHDKDGAAAQARTSLIAAYTDVEARTAHQTIVGDLGGQTFHAGIYRKTTAMALTGTVTLDAENDPSAIFIFQGDAAFDTAAGAQVDLVRGAQAANVYWQIDGAVGTAAGTKLAGTVMTAGAVTIGSGTQLIGRALSYGAVGVTASTVRFTPTPSPTLTIDGDLPDGATDLTTDSTPTISGTTDAGAGRPLSVTIAGQSLATTVAADGTWAATATTLAAGTYRVVASVRDVAGNGSHAVQVLTVESNPDPVALGSAGTYAALSGTSIVNTGTLSHLSGNVGVSPAGTVAGLTAQDVDGSIEVNTPPAAQARVDAEAAYADLASRAPHQQFTGVLGGRTFRAGIYHSTAALDLTGTMTLDAQGVPGQIFVFQGDAAMTTAALARVELLNGAQAANVYFQVAGAVTAAAGSILCGTVVSHGAVTLGDGARLSGRVIAVGTVTMADNLIAP